MAEGSDGGLTRGGPRLATALLASVIVGGTLGYVLLEGWSVWDAFYMTVITVTTVGYKEVHDLSFPGQVFTVVLLLAGVGAALYTFTLLATVVVEGAMPARLRQRRQIRMLERIKDHFILCGYGRIGSIIAREFARQKVAFVVVESDPARSHQAVEDGFIAIDGDASDDEVLTRAAIHRARGLVAAVGTDAENVYTVLSARVLRPDLFIVGRAETEDSIRKLRRAGANRVISPYQIGAQQLAQTAIRPAVVDFFALATSSENLELTIEEVSIGASSTFANQTILEANLRQRFGVIVVAIQRQDQRMEFNPEPSTRIYPGDKLVVLGRADSLKRLDAGASA